MPLPAHFYEDGFFDEHGVPLFDAPDYPWKITEDLWDRLPQVVREEDAKDENWFLKRFIGSGLGVLWNSAMGPARSAQYIPPWIDWDGSGTWVAKRSALAEVGIGLLGRDNGLEGYRWTAMVRGVHLPHRLFQAWEFEFVTKGVINNSKTNVGTKDAIITWLKNFLTDSKFIEVYHHTNDTSPAYGGDRWEMLIVTKTAETSFNVIEAVNDMRLKPAGVQLFHKFVEASDWNTIEAAYPTWDAWDAAGSWDAITTTE